MRAVSFGVNDVRIFLHLLGVMVWVGGQIVMLGLLPTLRALGGDAPKQAAAAFGRVAWPAFVLAVFTGIWNVMAVGMADVTMGYNLVLTAKLVAVVASGVAAWIHQTTSSPAVRGATGGIGFLAALNALGLGGVMPD